MVNVDFRPLIIVIKLYLLYDTLKSTKPVITIFFKLVKIPFLYIVYSKIVGFTHFPKANSI